MLIAVTPDLRKPGVWRVTYFGEDETPHGHTEDRNYAAAVHTAITEFGLDPSTIVVDPATPKRARDAARDPSRPDPRKARLITDLLERVNGEIFPYGPAEGTLEADAAVLGDALEEAGWIVLGRDLQKVIAAYRPGWQPEIDSPSQRWHTNEWEPLYRRIREAAQNIAHGWDELQNTNRHGVGYAPRHVETPFHDTLVDNGFKYRFSRRIWPPSKIGGNPAMYGLRHTYERRALRKNMPDQDVLIEYEADPATGIWFPRWRTLAEPDRRHYTVEALKHYVHRPSPKRPRRRT